MGVPFLLAVSAREQGEDRVKFRLRYQVLGGHTHVRVFAGKGEALGKCGDLVFRNEEWTALVHQLGSTRIRILQEGEMTK